MALFNGVRKFFTTHRAMECSYDGLMPKEIFWRALQRERERADRSGQRFAVVVFDFSQSAPVEANVVNFLPLLQSRLRGTDEIGWFDEDKVGVFLFMSSPEGAWTFINNLQKALNGFKPFSDLLVYTYPDDMNDSISETLRRRMAERVNLEASVDLMVVENAEPHTPMHLRMENISTSGVFIKTDSPLPVGSKVELNLRFSMEELKKLPGRSTAISTLGEVVRVEDRGMAVAFTDPFRISIAP